MMMRRYFLLISFMVVMLAAMGQPVHFVAGDLAVTIDKEGYYSSLKVCGHELLQSKQLYPVVSTYDYQVRTPQSVRLQGDTLICLMSDDRQVLLRIVQSPLCLTMEVIACPEEYHSLTFGPVAVAIDEVVGEVVGIAQGGAVAFGMQVLNIKTTGGIPQEAANDYCDKFFYQGHHVDGRPGYSLAATRIEGGTVFQFSGRNRGKRRGQLEVRQVGNCHAAIADPVDGKEGQIVGCKVALFGTSRAKVLSHIGLMETALGLPHPTTADGTWVKAPSPRTTQKKSVPKKPVTFVVKNVVGWDDPLVLSPLSSHLHKQLMFQLEEELDAADTSISILTGAYNCLPIPMEGRQVVKIEQELISYRSAQDSDGHVLLNGCRRGAFGSKAVSHRKYVMGSRLWTVKEGFVPDMELLDTLADRALQQLHVSSVRTIPMEILFEQLEYCALTGQDEYAVARFVSRFSQGWSMPDVIRADYVTNYTWHWLSGVTERGGNFFPDVSDTTWRFVKVVPEHDHTQGHSHGHSHGEKAEAEHVHAHEHESEDHAIPHQQPQVVKEETSFADFLKRNLLG